MKKFMIGFLLGIGVAVFGALFSGCNHRHKHRAAIYYITNDAEWTESDVDVETPPIPDIANEGERDCSLWPPGHYLGDGHENGAPGHEHHRHD